MHFKAQALLKADVKEPKHLSSWIHHQHSMTDKLKAAKGSADVVILSQQWVASSLWDRQVLNITDTSVFVREIVMMSEECAYWYGRTLIPETTYKNHQEFFGRLATESVRNLLFNGNQTQLVARVSYPVDRNCLEYFWVTKHLPYEEGIFWVRLAKYCLNQTDTFYLAEVLLPRLEHVS
jgi:chorismate lyase